MWLGYSHDSGTPWTCSSIYPETKLCLSADAAKSLQSCPTLCDPIDGSPPGSPIPGIHQARTPEWVAISFSNARKWKVKVKSLSPGRLFTTPTVYYIMLFTNSSDINRGLSPDHLSLKKDQLRALINNSPEHEKSISIQSHLLAF